jgi:gliding motility-associated-like protein
MHSSLPNPSTQKGLLAYYTFDNLKNKQGNSQWDGNLYNNASINQTNPECSLTADSCESNQIYVKASFTSADTICTNMPLQITNTSIGASNYYWSLCSADLNANPTATNLGNLNNQLNKPVFIDLVKDENENYFGFLINWQVGQLIRLKFGKSLLNTPVVENLGNLNNSIPQNSEGIQILKNNGSWYAIIVSGGSSINSSSSTILKVDFGASLSSNNPIVTNWGNIGNINYPHDLYVFQSGRNLYGYTINILNNSITRFNFGTDLKNAPTGVNLGNIGKLSYPCGFAFINYNQTWYAFVANRNSNSISRLNFGSSLLNTPKGVNLGNTGSFLDRPRDVSLLQTCSGITGLVVNEGSSDITKLNFGFNLTSNPSAVNLGNIGNLDFPHSISELFTAGNDIYAFIPNSNNNTLSRLQFSGCANIPVSYKENPDPIVYSEPGVYNVNLLVDIGLPTQTSFCKQIVVKNCDTICNLKAGFTYQQNTCDPKTIQFNDTTSNADSIWWNFGDGKTAGNVRNPVHQYADFKNYTIKLFAKTTAGCLDTAITTIDISIKKDSAIIDNDTSVCAGSSIQLKSIKGLKYCWSPSAGLSDSSIQNPVATIQATTKYYLNILTANNQPVVQDSIIISVLPAPVVNAGKDVLVCKGSSIQLDATGADTYKWNTSADLSDTTIANPVATPLSTRQFIVKGFNTQGCFNADTVKVSVLPLPDITLVNDTAVCKNGSVMLQANAAGNNIYNWYPSAGLSNTNIYDPVASPADTTKYFVTVTNNNNCKSADSVIINVLPKPVVAIMNDTNICAGNSVILKTTAANASVFKWSPSAGLNNAGIQNPQATPSASTLYTVTAGNGICSVQDNILVSILSLPPVSASNDTIVCGNAPAQLNATGALLYSWHPVNGLSDASISNPVATPGATTTYYVTGTGNNSCTNVDSVRVTINPPPAFNITPKNSSLCAGDSVLLIATGGDVYSWSPIQTLSSASTASTKAHPLQNTIYQVIITNSACKITSTLTSSIAVKDLPVVTITKSNDIDCINFEAQLTASGGVNYLWSPATNISSIHISNPKVTPRTDTRYFVTVKGTNGCSNKDSVLVNSTNANADAAKFEAATAFTPNHDGLNDCFNVKYWGTADVFDMVIYNRWGQLVFYTNDINKCWDGTFKGSPQATGTYVYVINISSNCSKGLIHRRGTVVLIR